MTDCSAAESITISNASVSGKDFQLDTGYSISGTIYQSDGVTPITDADIWIDVYQGDPCGDYTYVACGLHKQWYLYGIWPATGYVLRTYLDYNQSNYLDEWWAGAGSVPLSGLQCGGVDYDKQCLREWEGLSARYGLQHIGNDLPVGWSHPHYRCRHRDIRFPG